MEHLEPFRSEFDSENANPRYVPARAVKARHQTEFDRIAAEREDNWNCRGRRLGRQHGTAASRRDNDRYATSHKIRRQCLKSVIATLGPTKLYRYVLSLGEAGFGQATAEGGDARGPIRRRGRIQKSDYRHFGFLCAHSERGAHRRHTGQYE